MIKYKKGTLLDSNSTEYLRIRLTEPYIEDRWASMKGDVVRVPGKPLSMYPVGKNNHNWAPSVFFPAEGATPNNFKSILKPFIK